MIGIVSSAIKEDLFLLVRHATESITLTAWKATKLRVILNARLLTSEGEPLYSATHTRLTVTQLREGGRRRGLKTSQSHTVL